MYPLGFINRSLTTRYQWGIGSGMKPDTLFYQNQPDFCTRSTSNRDVIITKQMINKATFMYLSIHLSGAVCFQKKYEICPRSSSSTAACSSKASPKGGLQEVTNTLQHTIKRAQTITIIMRGDIKSPPIQVCLRTSL